MNDRIDVKIIEPKQVPPRRNKKPPEPKRVGNKIYVRAVEGFFSTIRLRMNWILMLVFYVAVAAI